MHDGGQPRSSEYETGFAVAAFSLMVPAAFQLRLAHAGLVALVAIDAPTHCSCFDRRLADTMLAR